MADDWGLQFNFGGANQCRRCGFGTSAMPSECPNCGLAWTQQASVEAPVEAVETLSPAPEGDDTLKPCTTCRGNGYVWRNIGDDDEQDEFLCQDCDGNGER